MTTKKETLTKAVYPAGEPETYELVLKVSCFVKARNRQELQKIYEGLNLANMGEDKSVISVEFKDLDYVKDENGDEFNLK
jgi:hypothetical protein